MANPGKEQEGGWGGQSHGSSTLCRYLQWDTELAKNGAEDAAATDKEPGQELQLGGLISKVSERCDPKHLRHPKRARTSEAREQAGS